MDPEHFFDISVLDNNLIGDEDPIPEENIGDLILNAFKSRPDFIGQVNAETEEQITFQQMRENSVKCALWLKQVGVKKGDVITICTSNPSVVYVPFLASIYIGAVVNPWDEKYFKDIIRVMYFLVKNKPDVIFVDNNNFIKLISAILPFKKIDKVTKIVTIGEIEPSIKLNSLESILNGNFDKAEVDEFSCEKNNMMDTAIQTLCSTETSYSAENTKIPYTAFTCPSNQQTPVMSPDDVGLWYGPLCWTHGPLLTVRAIISHVTAVKAAVFRKENLYKIIEKHKVTWMFLDVCEQLCNITDNFIKNYDISPLKMLLYDDWDNNKLSIHGKLTELLPNASVIRVYSTSHTGVIAYERGTNTTQYHGSKGYVTKNAQIIFINKNMKQVGPREVGRIFCRTPYTTVHRSENGILPLWYYTGDVGYYDSDGHIYIIGKDNHSIKYQNFVIFPAYVEAILHSHPAVSEAVMLSVPHSNDGRHVVAYVKTEPEAEVTEEELIKFIEINCPHPIRLHGGVSFITGEIPRLPNGKIDRMRIRHLN